MTAPTPFSVPSGLLIATRAMWVELDGPTRLRVRLATVAALAVALLILMGWALWDHNRVIASQQDEISRLKGTVDDLQEYAQYLEERLGILNRILSHRPALPHEQATALAHAVQKAARRYELEWQVLLAIIRVESGFDPRARSPRGAVGLMQVMPETLEEVATKLEWEEGAFAAPEDISVNVRVGAHYLFTLLKRFGDLEKALRAYHLGPSRIVNPSHEWEQLGRQYLVAVGLNQGSP